MTVAAVERELLDAIDRDREQIKELLQSLTRVPSEVGHERACNELIADVLKRWGIDARLIGSGPERPNVVAILKGKGGGKNLLFYGGHVDHVPVGELSNWKFDPYGGEYVDGWVRGRGTANSKASIAASMYALKLLVGSGFENKGDLVYTIVVDEESMGVHGAKFLVQNGHVYGDWAVLGVPGTQEQILVGCKGPLWLTIRVEGVPGHGAAPWLSINPIAKASKLILALQSLKFEKTHPAWVGDPRGTRGGPTGTISINTIIGGYRHNMVPESCDFTVDRRLLPNESPEEGLKQIQDVIDNLSREDPEFKAHVAKIHFAEPGSVISAEEPIVKLIGSCAQDALGVKEMQPKCAAGTGDNRWFNQAGIPTAGYGAGMFGPDGKVPYYKPNECVHLDEVLKAAKVYLLAMMRGTA